VPVLGLALAFGPAAGASTAGASPSARAAARTALEHLTVGWHQAFRHVSGPRAGVKGLSQVQSTNWSGYADTGSGFSTVTGSWTEPAATCSGRTTSLAAFWVGIDGYSSSSVEQDGALVECYRGTAYYYTCWEM